MSRRAQRLALASVLALLVAFLVWFLVRSPVPAPEPGGDPAAPGDVAVASQADTQSQPSDIPTTPEPKALNTNPPVTPSAVTGSAFSNAKESGAAGPSSILVPVSSSSNGPAPIELVWLPPGAFTLGSPPDEVGRRRNEGPQTQVNLTHGFWLGKVELTEAQWGAVMGAHPAGQFNHPSKNRPGPDYYKQADPDLPVTSIPWYLAMDFCSKLTSKERDAGRLPEGYVYRLPTEAEWEYACRAGTGTRFSFGDDPNYTLLNSYAWYGRTNYFTEINGQRWTLGTNDSPYPEPVGRKLSNPWGLYDMHGNVAEWCLDWLQQYPGGEVDDLVGRIEGPVHVFRGGSSIDPGANCRCAVRNAQKDLRGLDGVTSELTGTLGVGFRVALAVQIQ